MGADRREAKAMTSSDPDLPEHWRLALTSGDDAEILNWVRQSGLERVARIVCVLTTPFGEHGQPLKLHSLLLLKMAHLLRDRPHRPLRSVATDVAGEAHAHQPSRPAIASLVTKLQRDFDEFQHTWKMLSAVTNAPSTVDIVQDARRRKPLAEYRALARIVELLPGAIDAYLIVLADAKALGPDKAKLVKRVGRRRMESLFVDAIARQNSRSPDAPKNGGFPRIPGNFFELVEPDIPGVLGAPKRPASKRSPVGRKGGV
jgi:hypothetical protein